MWTTCTIRNANLVIATILFLTVSFKNNKYLLFNKNLPFSGFPSTVANSCDMNLSLSRLENQLSHLHVTAFFNGRGQAQKTNDYVSSSAVQAALGTVTTLSVIAWTITPRIVTARVKLTPQQLKLWANLDSWDFKEGRDNFSGTHLVVSHYV